MYTWTKEKVAEQGIEINIFFIYLIIWSIFKMVTALIMAGGKGTRMESEH